MEAQEAAKMTMREAEVFFSMDKDGEAKTLRQHAKNLNDRAKVKDYVGRP